MMKTTFATRFGLMALALSLSASTAFAGNTPAPNQVVVANTPAQPLPMVGLVKDSDASARKPFQWDGSIWLSAGGALNGSVTITTVPANQRLVIEHASGWCPSMIAVVTAGTYQQSPSIYHTLWLPAEFANGGALPASTPVRFYVDPQAVLQMSVNLVNPINVQRFCELSLSGYYVDLP